MPCVRAATATIGLLLYRARVPREIRRKICSLAFDLPDEEERAAEARRDAEFMAAHLDITVAAPADPPLLPGALEAASEQALAGEPGLTRVARTLVSASNWPEALHNLVSVIPGFGADGMVYCCSLFPFESSFPALVLPAGCCTLTIRSMCSSYKGLTSATPIDEVQVCVGGGVRQITKSDGTLDEAFFRRGLEFPTIERTFTAPRTSPSGRSYFTVADLARALNKLPESFTQIGRRHGLVAFHTSEVPIGLSIGRFTIPGSDGLRFSCCSVEMNWKDETTLIVDDKGRAVLEVAWSILSDFDNLIINEAFVDVNSTDPNEIIGMWNENTNKILSTFVPVPTDGSISMVMQKLWHRCVDFRRWAPACETLDDYLELLDGLD